jgi:ABC-2 type transport system ATP-binding protein
VDRVGQPIRAPHVASLTIRARIIATNLGDMPVIEVKHLQKSYGGIVAVDDVSFTVECGEIFGILGANGAGKTTTVETISGLRTPDRGSVTVFGLDPVRDAAVLRERVGVQLQDSALPDRLKVHEALALYGSFYADPADPKELMANLGLAEKAGARFATLSGGQRQRLSIALALVGNPEIAILDELTTGLDPQARRDTWALIERVRDRGVTIVLVTHVMEEAERLCDRLALIDHGRVMTIDTPAGVVGRVVPEQRFWFRPSASVEDAVIAGLPDVSSVSRSGDQFVVTGTGDALATVLTALAARGVVASDLRVEQTSLDDAFVALTGRGLDATGYHR